MSKLLIGLHAYAKSGKDTLADLLVSEGLAEKFSFSDALYREVADAFGVREYALREQSTKEVQSYNLALKECGISGFIEACRRADIDGLGSDVGVHMHKPRTPRDILQWWGTEYQRKRDPDYWVKRAKAWLDEQPSGVYINTSVRFLNEAAWVQRERGEIWKITRPGVGAVNGHESERPLGDQHITRFIANNGTVEDLDTQAKLALSLALKQKGML